MIARADRIAVASDDPSARASSAPATSNGSARGRCVPPPSLVSLMDDGALGAVLLRRGREGPAGHVVADAGLHRSERRGGVQAAALHLARDADRHAHGHLALGQRAVAQQRALVAGLDSLAVVVDDPADVRLGGHAVGPLATPGGGAHLAAGGLAEPGGRALLLVGP